MLCEPNFGCWKCKTEITTKLFQLAGTIADIVVKFEISREVFDESTTTLLLSRLLEPNLFVEYITDIPNCCVVGVRGIVRQSFASKKRFSQMLTRSNQEVPFGLPNVDGIASIARKTIEDFRAQVQG